MTAERQTTVLLKDERKNTADKLQTIEGRSEALEVELAAVEARHQEAIAARDRTIAKLKATLSQDTRSLDFALEDITVKDQRIASLEQQSADQERRISAQTEDLLAALGEVNALTRELAVLRDRMALATADLERERLSLAARQADLGAARTRLADGKTELDAARALLAARQAELDAARVRLADREAELGAAQSQLATRESELDDQRAKIADLDRKLAAALAQEVSELRRYRSEFFGRLRTALGDRPDIRIVGDRFVLQAEVLFASGSAEVDTGGTATLSQVADTLREVTANIPADVDWILRIDGHTDRIPISTGRFPSNWELSAARAISVLRFLAAEGVPPGRLGAMGFGEYQPLDPREDEIAYRRNRRIEFKLTQR